MGSKSAKAKIDKFYMSAHYGVCVGPVDSVKRIQIKEKDAWRGHVAENTSLGISKGELFGGLLKEGGVSGVVDVMMGGPTQKVSSWLASKFGRSVDESPGYRGVLSLVFRGSDTRRGFYWTATTPYLGNLWVTVARFPRSLDPSTAKILRREVSLNYTYEDVWKYTVVPPAEGGSPGLPSAYTSPYYDDSHWPEGPGGFGSSIPVPGFTVGTYIPAGVRGKGIWIRKTIDVQDPKDVSGINIDVAHDDGCWLWWNGIPIPLTTGDGYYHSTAYIPGALVQKRNVAAMQVLDGIPGGGPSHIYAGMKISSPEGDNDYDANPAHIIFECVTDRDWGLGWDVSSINMPSFLSSAQTLFNERFGLSLAWMQSSSVEEFVNEILDCIKGAIFTDPRTGKLTLRLIRDDYDVDNLPVLNPDNATLQNFSRKAWGETVNEMKVTWTNPETEGEESVSVQDLGNIAMQGAVVADSKGYYGVRRADLAQRLANRDLRQASAPLCACEATVNRSLWAIAPYDCIRLNWPEFGIDNTVMRVVDVNYGSTGSNAIKLSLVEDIFSLPEVAFVPPPAGEWVNPEQPPEPITEGRIMPVPAYFAAQSGRAPATLIYPDTLATLIVPAPGGGLNTDYTVEVEQPTPSGGTEWISVGQPRTFLGSAKLNSALTGEVESTVALSNEQGPLAIENSFLLIGPASAADEDLEIALVVSVDPETSELSILRGALDTCPREWPAGTDVWVADVDDLWPLDELLVTGQTVRARATGQDGSPVVFADVVDSRPSRPLRPANVRINGVGFGPMPPPLDQQLNITWSHRNRTLEDTAVLRWDAASTAPEAGVSYSVVIDVYGPGGVLIEADWVAEDVGAVDSAVVDLSAEVIPAGAAILEVRVDATRVGESNWQSHSIPVSLLNAPADLTIEPLE